MKSTPLSRRVLGEANGGVCRPGVNEAAGARYRGAAPMRWRMLIVLLWLAGLAAIGATIASRGWQSGWRVWGVATHDTPWLDLRVITAAVATRAEGGDPYHSNPHDPTGRPFNYPSIWLRLLPAAVSERGYASIAGGFAAAAVAGLLMWLGPVSLRRGAFVGVLLLSPSLLLGIERANSDLLIFGLTAAALALLAVGSLGAAIAGLALLLAATGLKIYPVIVLGTVFVLARGRVARAAAVTLALALLGLALNIREVTAALTNSGSGAIHSYGIGALAFWIELHGRVNGWSIDPHLLDWVLRIAALAIVAVAVWRGLRVGRSVRLPHEGRAVGLAVSAALFTATFVAGSSFNYRLWFALLGIPWLLGAKAWPDREVALAARVALASLVLMLFASGVWWLQLTWVSLITGWFGLYANAFLLTAIVTAAHARTAPELPETAH